MGALRETPIRECHLEMAAKMGPFAGWQLPINYPGGILSEHRHTREAASIFDICHMGELRIAGPGAVPALDRLLARRIDDLAPGACRYNFLLNERGGVLDDLLVYRMAEEDCLLVVNADTTASDRAWLRAGLPPEIAIEDLSPALAKIDLQGPASAEVLAALGIPLTEQPKYFHWGKWTLGEDLPCIISRTGYTGELGFELYCRNELAIELWGLLLETPPVAPAGLGARDTLRLEAGLPLYGHELSPEITPLEAGFGRLLRLDDDREFVGKAALLTPPTRELLGIRLSGRRAARSGTPVRDEAGRELGVVTSGAFGPTLGVALAMALVQAGTLRPGSPVRLGEELTGTVCSLPFYYGSARD